jgi:osmoprotectant transport system ATP-binding protein
MEQRCHRFTLVSMILRLEEVTKSLAGKIIVGPISLDFATATTTVLLGPKACGKSTLLRLLAGLELADSGKVIVDDVELDSGSIQSVRRKIAYTVAGGALFPHLTVEENITLRLERANVSAPLIARRLAETTQLFRISPEGLRRYPHQLSEWQCFRVAMARALMPDPQILLFDDVLGSFDRLSRAYVIGQFGDLLRRLNKTVVWATHDLNEAMHVADHAVLIINGLVVQRGHLMDLMDNPVDVRVKNFMHAEHLF